MERRRKKGKRVSEDFWKVKRDDEEVVYKGDRGNDRREESRGKEQRQW